MKVVVAKDGVFHAKAYFLIFPFATK
jgi:hypothetical protein